MIGIYKITNLINNKSYVGQSIRIERRFQEHQKPSSKSLISFAINKYGKKYFAFEVLEETKKEKLNEREKYYIDKYKTLVPNGYNITYGEGSSENTSFNYYDEEVLDEIAYLLKNELLNISEIANKYCLHKSTISRINSGEIHFREKETYPLMKTQGKKKYYCEECGEEIVNPTAKRCRKCYVKSLYTTERPEPMELAKEIVESGFSAVGRKYNVSDNAIKKWCKAYNIPHLKKDLKEWYNKQTG